MRMKPILALLFSALLCCALAFPAAGEAGAASLSFPDLKAGFPEGTFLAQGEPAEITKTSYRDADIAISITSLRDEESKSDVYVADIKLASPALLRRGFPLGKWKGEMRSLKTIAEDSGAILAMTGDYSALLDVGLVVANGKVYRKSENRARDNCLILSDGRMLTYPRREMIISEVLDDGIWQSFLFGPALLNQGEAITSFDAKIRPANPRSAIGYYAPGHYCFVVVDGRSKANKGMTLTQLSAFMKNLGCQTAYNLDGGQSALMWFNGNIVNDPYHGGRRLMDIVYIGRPLKEE